MLQVLIAGGGIGGLSLALALAKRGIGSHVFEGREAPQREGAGIQLGPNAARLLVDLGLGDAIEKVAVAPDCIVVNDGLSGRELARLPLGRWMAERHGAPYWVVHRANLYDVLWQNALNSRLITTEPGRTVTDINDVPGADHINIAFAQGNDAAGDVLVGADGIWSNTRRQINPNATLGFTGMIAARAVVPRAQVPPRFAKSATGVWLAPSAHVVHYPVNGGDEVAIVAIAHSDEASEGWNTAVGHDVVMRRFDGLASVLQDFLMSIPDWRQWALYRTEQAPHWSKGRIVLIGDAAHPILPFLAQGGAMAIEDGYELAACLARSDASDLVAALETFSLRRRQRVAKVQAASVENGRVYHLKGLAALARNAALEALPGSLFMRRYDWIYGYKP